MDQIKITFVQGLQEVILDEISKNDLLKGKIFLIERSDDSLFFNIGTSDESKIDVKLYDGLISLKSVTNVFLVQRGEKLHPPHISNHKSILGDMIETALALEKQSTPKARSAFKTFRLRCAGSDSPEAQAIQGYISENFKLQVVSATPIETVGAGVDLDTYIHKPDALWEVGVRLTPRPLSVRDYKIEHIKGGINPTVAYAMNTMAFLHTVTRTPSLSSPHLPDHNTHANLSYLNICSGSATLLIEACLQFEKLKESAKSGGVEVSATSANGYFLGFDIDKKTNSQAIHNIQNAGLIRDIQIKTADLLDNPDFGATLGNEFAKFDIITSDLPFGMQIGKNDDLDKLYKAFVEYATEKLKENGVLVVYTTEVDTLGKALRGSAFTIEKTISLKLTTSVGSIIQPKIFVCSKKAD